MVQNFSVPDPCSENWNNMLPDGNGRYCGSCQKVVVDFTNMSDQQIIDHIAANTGKKLCGTFKNSQLQKPSPVLHHDQHLRFLAALLLVFGMTLFSCGPEKPAPPKIAHEPYITTGITMIPPPPVKDTLVPKTREEYAIPQIIQKKTTICSTTTGIVEDLVQPEETLIPDTVQEPEPLIVGMLYEPTTEFPEAKMKEYIKEHVHYPDSAKTNGISGNVYVRFTVCEDGSIADVKVLRGIGYGCDEEALRVVSEMPKWKPVTRNGTPVKVQINIPIKFILQ